MTEICPMRTFFSAATFQVKDPCSVKPSAEGKIRDGYSAFTSLTHCLQSVYTELIFKSLRIQNSVQISSKSHRC